VLHPGNDALTSREEWWLHIWARLAPGESAVVGEQRLRALGPEVMKATLPSGLSDSRRDSYLQKNFRLLPAAQGVSNTGKQYRIALYTLLVIVGLVLLIACANIANLLLARASARRREFSLRLSIGASRWRIIRQLMTESLLLSILGAGGGVLLAYWGGPMLIGLLSTAGNPVRVDLAPELRTLAFTAGAAVLTALLFGLVPALRATRANAAYALAAEARGLQHESGRPHLAKLLVAVQIALSLVLLVGAGLFLGTLRNYLTADTGFDRRNILLVTAEPETGAPTTDRARIHRDILARLGSLPGVVSASASYLPPMGRAGWNGNSYPEGFVPQSRRDSMVFFNRVSYGYFRTMRAPLLAGREFTDRDDRNAPLAIIINESAARRFFGQNNAIGKTIGLDRIGKRGERDIYQVVGVVKDARYNRIDEAPRQIAYLPLAQDPNPTGTLVYEVRTAGPVEGLAPSIRTAIGDVDRGMRLEFRSLDTQVMDSILQPRLVALLSAVFGGLALALAMVGLYGITAYGVARRKGEIGIRMALGAQRESVVWLMLREVLALLAIGTVVGLSASLAGGKYVKSLLFGLEANDPAQLAGAAAVLTLAALLAAWLPARRASRIDPMAALRDE
jgi:predicted permease